MSALNRLFSPKTIAVIGGRIAESVVVELNKLGFAGHIWPVNPNRAQMDGIACLKSIDALPGVPDAVYIAVPRDTTVELVGKFAEMGAGGAICHASGFSEHGDKGQALSDKLVAAAGEMPILGPNCWGVLNLIDKVALWPDFHGAISVESGIAIVSQSGNMSINYTMQKRGLPIAYVVNLGNQAMVDANDCIEAFLDDDRVSAIGVHVEGLKDVARFSTLAHRAFEKKVPIVAFKSGASEKGARATMSHTSTLAGPDALYDALFARCGVARARSVPGFLETLKLLSLGGSLGGNEIASLSCSGGEASLIADRVEHRNLTFPDLAPEQAKKVQATLNEFVDVTNPLDYHTFIWGDYEAMEATYGAMMEGEFDLTVNLLDYPREDRSKTGDYTRALDAWATATKRTGARTAVIATLPECMPEHVATKLYTQGIAPLMGLEEALDAIEAASQIWKARASELRPAGPRPQNTIILDEWHSKQMLAATGLTIPSSSCVAPADAAKAVDEIGYPVVLKAIGKGLEHKTEAGGVVLNLNTHDDVIREASRLAGLSHMLLVEEMITDAVAELIVGIDRDDQFGPYMVIGAGGVLVEILKDSATLLLPASTRDIETALRGLKMFPLIEGYRGKPAGDLAATISTIKKIVDFAVEHWDDIVELDVNPLLVRPDTKGAVAADALISIRKEL
jgi:acyl-CoA synthetase (NDP forming)